MLSKRLISIALLFAVVGCADHENTVEPAMGIYLRNTPISFLTPDAQSLQVQIGTLGRPGLSWTASLAPSVQWARLQSGVSDRGDGTIVLFFDKNEGGARDVDLVISAPGADGSPLHLHFSQSAVISRVHDVLWSEKPSGWTFHYENYTNDRKPWNHLFAEAPGYPVRMGWASERYELRPGDCFGDDCNRQPSFERAESAQDGQQQYEGDEYWYGWSFFVPADIPGLASGFTHFGQFQQHSLYNPIWMFTKVYAGDFVMRYNATAPGGAKFTFPLMSDSEFRGRWHDIVVHAKWALDTSGFTRVWVNGTKMVDYSGPTRTAGNTDVYFKYGIYRAASPVTTVIYYDELRRGKTRQEVDIRYIESTASESARYSGFPLSNE